MPVLPAASAEPRHSRGGAGGVRPRRRARRSEQTVDVPDRVARGPHYSDAFKKAWCKIAALDVDANAEHCNASVQNLAGFSGMSKPAFERALTEGHRPGPDGSEPEFTTERRTHRGGRGRTAIREVRPVAYDEPCVTVPVWIVDAAEPRELAAVLAIARAQADGHQLTYAELAGELFHHRGLRKGRPLSERTARRLSERLRAKGFITVDPRAGYQGRDVLAVRTLPVEEVTDRQPTLSAPAPGPDNHDGSGPDSRDGSLASKEDQQVCTDEEAQVGGPFRRRRGDRKWAATPVDTASNTATAGNGAGVPGTFRPAAPARPYDGPRLTLSPRVWAVLAPVHDLLPGLRPFVLRRLAREIGAHLNAGVLPEDLTEQLRRVRAWTPDEEIRDPGRWLLAAALPLRHGGCGRTDCVGGYQRHTGHRCKACQELLGDRIRAHAPHAPPSPHRAPHKAPPRSVQPLLECPGCAAPYRPPARHPCRLCGTELTAPA